MAPSARARSYCFTLNNPTSDEIEQVDSIQLNVRYLIYGKEVGDSGTPHLQGYLMFHNPTAFSTVKKLLPRAHIEIAKGSPQDNIKYCSKGGEVKEFGETPKMGERTDIDQVRDIVKEGGNMRRVLTDCTSYQSAKFGELYLKYHEKPRDWFPVIHWYHGSTRSGKSRSAHAWLKETCGDDVYNCMDTARWFEGYDGHKGIIFDDFRKDFCKFHVLLRMLDRYPYRVENKGGSRQLVATHIAITSPYHPASIYANREDVNQLLERIKESGEIIQCGSIVHYHDRSNEPDFIDPE